MDLVEKLKQSLVEEIDVDVIDMLESSEKIIDDWNIGFAKKQILTNFFNYGKLLSKINKNGTYTRFNIKEAVSICLREDILDNLEYGKKIIIFLEELSSKGKPMRLQLFWHEFHDKIGIHVAEINNSSVLNPGDGFIYS